MVDRLNRLRHDSVVSRDNEDRDIGSLCTSCAHCGECFVSGGVKEGYRLTVDIDSVRANVLCDAASLACGNIRMADSIEYRGLSVVNMTHDNDDRRSRNEIFLGILCLVEELFLDRDPDLAADLCAEFVRDEICGIVINDLIDICHDTEEHESLYDLGSRDLEP